MRATELLGAFAQQGFEGLGMVHVQEADADRIAHGVTFSKRRPGAAWAHRRAIVAA
jgi:hypothetical protein